MGDLPNENLQAGKEGGLDFFLRILSVRLLICYLN